MFGEMKLRVVSLFKMAHNGIGLGEVADPKLNRITKLKIKNE